MLRLKFAPGHLTRKRRAPKPQSLRDEILAHVAAALKTKADLALAFTQHKPARPLSRRRAGTEPIAVPRSDSAGSRIGSTSEICM